MYSSGAMRSPDTAFIHVMFIFKFFALHASDTAHLVRCVLVSVPSHSVKDMTGVAT